MPQTDPERQERWETDVKAIAYLEGRGFKLRRDFCWELPAPGYVITTGEDDALVYLIEEWDYGGLAAEHQEGVPVPSEKEE